MSSFPRVKSISVTIDGNNFKVVKDFAHLPRILIKGASSGEVGPTMDSTRICGRRRFTHAPNRLSYRHETWTILEEDMQALEVLEHRVLRTIYGDLQENGVWLQMLNHELAALWSHPSTRR